MPCTRYIFPDWPSGRAVSQHLTVGDLKTFMMGKEICQNVAWAYDTLVNNLGKDSVRITSIRRGVYDSIAGIEGGNGSKHLYGLAVDFAFNQGAKEKLFSDDGIWSSVMSGFQKIGVGGLGLYDTHIHVDFRETTSMWYDKRTQKTYNWVFWDYRKNKDEFFSSFELDFRKWPWYYWVALVFVLFFLTKR